MAINKFVDRQGNTLLDLSADSVSENRVLAGTTYHGPDGLQHTGTLDPGPMDYSQYNFIDYDGTLLYSYTDEELDALTALPAGPDHTADNLTFQEWNWTLADLKAWDRTRPDRPLVGANLITTDGKSYIYIDTPYAGATLSFSSSGKLNSVDWGDGTIDTNTSHVYTNPGQYVVAIDMAAGGYFEFSSNGLTTSTNKQWIKKVKLGNLTTNDTSMFYYCPSLQSISIPSNLIIKSSTFYNCYSLRAVVLSKSNTALDPQTFYGCYSIKNISLPNSIVSTSGNYHFFYCDSLDNVVFNNNITTIEQGIFNESGIETFVIPNNVTEIKPTAFINSHKLKNISIPDSVTSIGNRAFYGCFSLNTLDLSKQTKVITLTSDIGLTIYIKILVPSALLGAYQSAPYWSDYRSSMVGV